MRKSFSTLGNSLLILVSRLCPSSVPRNWQEKLALTEKRKLEEAEKLKVLAI